MKILLAVDGSSFSDSAVAEVGSRPWPPATEIKIVTAFQVPITATPEVWTIADEYYPALEQAAREQAQAVVDAAVAKLATQLDKSLSLSGEVLNGPPREAILDEAERWPADLIVMGSHGYGTWQRLWLGSVSQAVVSHANCSVEVVHRSKSDNDAKAA
jgi:nucleotide-binding universal stress UspA family protein